MTPGVQLCLIRHGETDWSLSGQHTGVTDLGLTAHGRNEARALAPRLQAMAFAHILVSPSLRARQTCELAGFAAASRIEADLSEWNYGQYEGLRSVDIQGIHPEWNIWRDGCPGGESAADIGARADRLIASLEQLRGTVALFSHGQFGAALAVRWIGLALTEGEHFALHTASLSVLGLDAHHAGRHVIELWNECPKTATARRDRATTCRIPS